MKIFHFFLKIDRPVVWFLISYSSVFTSLVLLISSIVCFIPTMCNFIPCIAEHVFQRVWKIIEILCVLSPKFYAYKLIFPAPQSPFFLFRAIWALKYPQIFLRKTLALIMAPFKISEIQTRYSFIILCELFQKSDLCIYNTQDPNSFLVISMAQTDEFNLIQII